LSTGSSDVERELAAPATLGPSERSGVRRSRLATIAQVACVLLMFALISATHSRWILTHFSSDGYLEDSGWLAYLFESADPLLGNPSGVNDLSFYAHHLSPHIFLFGAPLATLPGFTGIEIFAWHQGLFFGLFFLSFCLIVARSDMRRRDWMLATAAALVLGGLSNALFQAASYPHYEIALIAIASLALAAWLARYRLLFVLCLAWLPLVREDGGFYAAVVCIACLAVEQDRERRLTPSTRLLTVLALAGLAASASSFLIKAWLFPGFNAFANNFSGDGWNHVTAAFVADRVRAMLRNLSILPVLLGSALLAAFDMRYLTGLVLLSPILLLHLLAVRPEHGYFTLYFALPWLLPCAIWLAVFVKRARTSQAAVAEGVIILTAALALSAPIQAAAGARGAFWFVSSWAFQRPVEDIPGMQDFVRWARKSLAGTEDGRWPNGHKGCVSFGIAALIPDDIRPDEVLTTRSGLRACDVIFLMRGDVQYAELSTQARAAGFERTSSKRNVEIWVVR
jgi:hypothetical protein